VEAEITGRMEFDILVLEKYNDITVETVAIDFLKGPLQFQKLPFFFSLFCLCAVLLVARKIAKKLIKVGLVN